MQRLKKERLREELFETSSTRSFHCDRIPSVTSRWSDTKKWDTINTCALLHERAGQRKIMIQIVKQRDRACKFGSSRTATTRTSCNGEPMQSSHGVGRRVGLNEAPSTTAQFCLRAPRHRGAHGPRLPWHQDVYCSECRERGLQCPHRRCRPP